MDRCLIIDVPERDVVRLTVEKEDDVLAVCDIPYTGAVDNALLTLIDNLFSEHILDKFASYTVKPGPGIDKNSILYRMVLTLSAALERVGDGRPDA